MKTRKTNRLLAVILCLCMVFGTLPLTGMTSAAEVQTCFNHAVHDDTCGFAQAVEGCECGHTHDDKCGYTKANEDAFCRHEQGEHDENCGYIAAVEGKPCGHTCELCDGSKAANALPLGEEAAGTYSISGSVRSARVLPLIGVGVTLWQGDQQVRAVITDDFGQYSFTSLAAGEYMVKAGGGQASDGVYYIEESEIVTITEKNESCSFNLEPGNAPGTYSISGRVRNGSDHPFGLDVTLWQDGQQIRAVKTGLTGEYSLTSLVPGTYIVKASGWLGGVYYAEKSETVTITEENQSCSFDLQPGNAPGHYSISGKVILSGVLNGISDIPVELWQDGKQISETKTVLEEVGSSISTNKFVLINILPGTYTLRVPAGIYGGTYYLEGTNTLTLEEYNISWIELELQPGTAPGSYAVTGTIKGSDNSGLSGVSVQLMTGDIKRYEVTTIAGGSFSFEQVAAGAYTLKIPAGTYGGTIYPETSKAIELLGQDLPLGDLKLAAATVPTVPRNFTTAPGIGQVELTWTAPQSNGGVDITKYEVSKDGGASWTDASNATGHTFTGLTGGQSYTFQVRAVNGVGAGEAASVTAAPIVPGPSAPQSLYAQYGNQTLYLHWKAPVSNGGAVIVKYQYSATADGTEDWKDIPDSGPDTVTYTVTGLTNGTTYTLKVRAVNSNGGVGEAASTMLAPGAVAPSVPRNLTATPGDGQMTLNWEVPESDGGLPITHYQYRYNVDPDSVGGLDGWTRMPDSGPDTVSFTVTGLENGKELAFFVRAWNSYTASTAAMVMGTPHAETPATFTLTVTNGTDVTASGSYAEGEKVNIRANAPADGKLFKQWTSSGGGSFDDANSPETTFTMPAGNVTVTATYEDDRIAPTGTITVKNNGWTEFLDAITYGVFFKETQQVSITAQDNSGQEAAIAYYMAAAAMTLDQVQELAGDNWTAYAGAFSIAPNAKLVVYARLTDKAGNVTYISSNGIVLDNVAPTFSLEDGKTYDSAQTLTVTDNYALASVKLGKAEQLSPDFTGAETQIALNVNGDYTIEATDKAGNTAAITVTINTPPPSVVVYRLTVTDGRDITDSGPYAEGTQVRIQADAATSGMTFDKWSGGADSIFVSGSRTSSTTTITMPAGDVEVKATYKRIDNGGSSSNNGGSSNGGGGSSSDDGSEIGVPKSGYTVTGDKVSQTVSHTDLKKLADSGKSLTLNSGTATMTFAPDTLNAIQAAVPATAGNITVAATPADISAFPEAAKLIGNRPLYNYVISYKDSKGNTVNANASFPAGSASISLSYTPAEGEVTGNLFMVYVDDKGAVTWLNKSSYAGGKIMADVPHFSIYGVAYKAPATVFTDITNHWAKADIEFAAARGLLSGTGEKVFAPDAAMTRGMFVTALGRLAGVNPTSYQTRSFTDVKADAYYAAYAEWAAQANIVKGTGEGIFSPDAPVTREQMAVMMTNYAGQMGYSIPAPLAAVTFADNANISTWAEKEVAAMQRAGIIKGKDGNRFDPQASATRAEVSAVLCRFVEISIDPVTAQGWVKNDSGQWLYYKDGKTLTGWQTVGNLRYYFNADGVMHEGWKQDTNTGKWYYWTNAGAAIGWREIDSKWYYFDENGVMAAE